MNQFDKRELISFKLESVESVSAALKRYEDILTQDKAIRNDLFDVEFVAETDDGVRRLQVADTKKNKLLKDSFNMGQEGGAHNYPDKIEQGDEIYISEPIFFGIALEYPELKTQIEATAKAMVALSRRNNDTSEMWVDDMRVFGVEALYMVARTYSEYSYLLAQFLIPYWDDEHAVGYEEYLRDLRERNGWSRDVIKAFVWCDNNFFRQAMNGDGELLGDYLKKNPTEYEFFKQTIRERFAEEQYLLSDDDADEIEEANPVLDIYFATMVSPEEWAEDIDENEDIIQSEFVNDTFENEAFDLQEEIKASLDRPLAKISESAIKQKEFVKSIEEDDDNYEVGDGLKDILALFKHLPRGEEICKYIETGEYRDAVETLEQTELLPLAQRYVPQVYNKMVYFTTDYRDEDELRGELGMIFSEVASELLSPDDDWDEEELSNGLVARVLVRSAGSEPFVLSDEVREDMRQRFLRILDVFYFAMGRKPLNDAYEELIADPDNDPIMGIEVFNMRYGEYIEGMDYEQVKRIRWQKKLAEILDEIGDTEIRLRELRELDEIYKYRDVWECTKWDKKSLGTYFVASYFLNKDFAQRVGDKQTQELFGVISEGFAAMVYDMIFKGMNYATTYYPANDKNLIYEEGRLKVENYLTAPKTELNDQEAYELFDKYLVKSSEPFSEKQPFYGLFNNYDDEMQAVALMLYWLMPLPLPTKALVKRQWMLLLNLAPQAVIRLITKAVADDYYDSTFNDTLREIEHYESLEKVSVPQAQTLAYQLSVAMSRLRSGERTAIYNYIAFLENYQEITSEGSGMFGAIDKKKAIALDWGMQFLNERKRVAFFKHLSLVAPEFPFEQEHLYRRTLERVIGENTKTLYHFLEDGISTDDILHSGYSRHMKLDDETVIETDEKTLTLPSTVINEHNLSLVIMQQRGEKLYIVLQNKEFAEAAATKVGDMPYVRLVIVKETADVAAIHAIYENMPTREQCKTETIDAILKFVDGEIEYEQACEVFARNIRKDEFDTEPKDKKSALATLGQFIWAMSDEKLERYIKLLMSHTSDALPIFDSKLAYNFFERKVAAGKLDFPGYLYDRVDERDEQQTEALTWLIGKMIELDVPTLTIIKVVNDYYRDDVGNVAAELTGRDDFLAAFSTLSVDDRETYIELVSEADDCINFLPIFKDDESRQIRMFVESLIQKNDI